MFRHQLSQTTLVTHLADQMFDDALTLYFLLKLLLLVKEKQTLSKKILYLFLIYCTAFVKFVILK